MKDKGGIRVVQLTEQNTHGRRLLKSSAISPSSSLVLLNKGGGAALQRGSTRKHSTRLYVPSLLRTVTAKSFPSPSPPNLTPKLPPSTCINVPEAEPGHFSAYEDNYLGPGYAKENMGHVEELSSGSCDKLPDMFHNQAFELQAPGKGSRSLYNQPSSSLFLEKEEGLNSPSSPLLAV
ncbi:hypothetical protein P7K49_038987 [Saguinus oedipus]|uniref:Uncharacterized protein n=1 Tax=Saguinus oedipus TaxID=9490 RepID=A0ABQ9TGB5_SAGOE|nr:hypothetical protein P7K49_038987 [Saguinus oedipus]